MNNKAAKITDAFPSADPEKYESEFKILVEASVKDKTKFDIHIHLAGHLQKVFTEVDHYHLVTPFGDDAE